MQSPTRRLAIFAHWDPDAIIDDYVIELLKPLSGLCDVVFSSDCELSASEVDKIKPLSIAQIFEPHGEYDFGSYKRGFVEMLGQLESYDELVFINDSCYGPFKPLPELWESMTAQDCDFWGMFEHYDSRVGQWHIQSYFMVFKPQVFLSEVFHNFILKIRKQPDKEAVIINYEIGLSGTLMDAGFKSASLCPPSLENLTHHRQAFGLIRDHGMPFVKKSLLIKNHLQVPLLIEPFLEFRQECSDSPAFALMMSNVERMAGSKYPIMWFHGDLANGMFLHPKFIRFKEKPLRWINLLHVKIGGVSFITLPWKLNVRRIRFDLKHRDGVDDTQP